MRLPGDFRQFLLRWNGATLFADTGHEQQIYVLDAAGLVEEFREQVDFCEQTGEPYPPGLLVVAQVPATGGDYIALEARGRALDCYHVASRASWLECVIADNFAGWLDRTLAEGYFWLKAN